jgi:peroxiredoxin Q/BCP
VVGVDGEARDAGPGAGAHRPCGEGFVKQGDERFWQVVGERPQAGSEARTEDECLGHASALARARSHFKPEGGKFPLWGWLRHVCLRIAHSVRVSETMNKITKILTAITTGVFAATATAEPLAVGAALPQVTQKNQDSVSVKLSEAGASGYLLVYFYPKADTPGCTKQACSLRDSYAALTDKGVKIFGVSMDDVAAQKAFKEKYKLPFDLLADTDGAIASAFGVPRMMGFAKRQAYLFKDGKLVWQDSAASTDKQAADVLKALEETP